LSTIFIGNRFHVTLHIFTPKICKQCSRTKNLQAVLTDETLKG